MCWPLRDGRGTEIDKSLKILYKGKKKNLKAKMIQKIDQFLSSFNYPLFNKITLSPSQTHEAVPLKYGGKSRDLDIPISNFGLVHRP
jgi:hypothetical protein